MSLRQYQIPKVKPPLDQGATVQPTFPVPPVTTNPPIDWWGAYRLGPDRYQVQPPKRLEGATVQATFIFPPNQPEISRWWYTNFRYAEAKRPLEGATIQDWFIYPPNQPTSKYWAPDLNRYLQELGPRKQTDGATNQQTYVFPVNQPTLGYTRTQPIFQYPRDQVVVVVPFIPGLPNQPVFAYYVRNNAIPGAFYPPDTTSAGVVRTPLRMRMGMGL